MAINFLSLIGFKSKSRKEQPTPSAPAPQPPVPEVTAELSVKEDFHEEIAHTGAGWFRFDSDSSRLLASMTVSYDVRETTHEFKTDWRANCHMVETPVRIVHTSAMIRLYRSSAVALKTGEGHRCFVVCDRGGSFINGAPATVRRFYSLDEDGECQMANYCLTKTIPFAFIGEYPFFSEVSNERITDITIPDEAALKSLIPNY